MRRILAVMAVVGMLAALSVPAVGAEREKSEPMMTGLAGWSVEPLLTVGMETGTYDDYVVSGILDGLAVWRASDLGLAGPAAQKRVRVLANHEFNDTRGSAYRLANGTELTGARISFIDIDIASRKVVDAGLAYGTVYDRSGDIVVDASQINEDGAQQDGFDRFCSAQGVDGGSYDFVDDIYFANEESGVPFHPHGGTVWALDVEAGELWAVPAMGRGAWENVTPVETDSDPSTVEIILGDDSAPAPLYYYVGVKTEGDFLDRNGLGHGVLYAWAGEGVSTPDDFNTAGSAVGGAWVEVAVQDKAMAGADGYDDAGYLDVDTLQDAAAAAGAFLFSRPEDVATNPADGGQVVLASTGRGQLYQSDNWGALYLVDVANADVSILYDGDFTSAPDFGLRSPDNVDWAADGSIYVQEDRSTRPGSLFGGTSGREASIWSVSPTTGMIQRIAEMDRTAVPDGQVDVDAGQLGSWESSGVIDVTDLFSLGRASTAETVLLADVQAHGIELDANGLVEGGQLILLTR